MQIKIKMTHLIKNNNIDQLYILKSNIQYKLWKSIEKYPLGTCSIRIKEY